ncbi:MAG TPA: hypothetical protein VJT71_13855 [Pyrinomonadaceae bacterium]|nr:hypothetical protein [Pyrinomonadaceae bacterium]
MRTANKTVYVVFGIFALLYAVTALFSPATLGGEAARSFHLEHTMREQGAAGIFIALMFFWCAFNYERRESVHYFLMVFALLVAAIHWFDYFNGDLRWISPVYNSVPFAVLLVMAIFGRIEKRRGRAGLES